jgi:hypothetical protein
MSPEDCEPCVSSWTGIAPGFAVEFGFIEFELAELLPIAAPNGLAANIFAPGAVPGPDAVPELDPIPFWTCCFAWVAPDVEAVAWELLMRADGATLVCIIGRLPLVAFALTAAEFVLGAEPFSEWFANGRCADGCGRTPFGAKCGACAKRLDGRLSGPECGEWIGRTG